MKKGKLFVFEGPDGNGKTTTLENVFKLLQKDNLSVSRESFPGRKDNTLGKHIYEVHHKNIDLGITNIHPASLQTLHVAAHIESINDFIHPAIEKGEILLLDRFWWSTLIYGITSGIPPDSMNLLIEWERVYWKGLAPECVFIVKREKTPLRQEMSLDKWEVLQKAYQELADSEKSKYPTIELMNEGTPEEVAYVAYQHIKSTL